MNASNLSGSPAWGWTPHWQELWEQHYAPVPPLRGTAQALVPARVHRQDQQIYTLAQGPRGEIVQARVRGRQIESLRPVLGDWSLYNPE